MGKATICDLVLYTDLVIIKAIKCQSIASAKRMGKAFIEEYKGNSFEIIINQQVVYYGKSNSSKKQTPKSEEEKIMRLLDDHHIMGEVYSNRPGVICIEIHWGDWKHSHLYVKHLMVENGYEFLGTEVTEDDSSDAYSAIHHFKKRRK